MAEEWYGLMETVAAGVQELDKRMINVNLLERI